MAGYYEIHISLFCVPTAGMDASREISNPRGRDGCLGFLFFPMILTEFLGNFHIVLRL